MADTHKKPKAIHAPKARAVSQRLPAERAPPASVGDVDAPTTAVGSARGESNDAAPARANGARVRSGGPTRSGAQLPSGRHGLSPEYVQENQRERILEAMVRTVGRKGYAETSVGDVLAQAGVSRRTFYDLFEDKEDCFLQAYDAVVARMMHEVKKQYDQPRQWPDKVRAGLSAFLAFFAYEEDLVRMAMVEVRAAGPEALKRYEAAERGFVPFLEEGRVQSPYRDRLPPNISEAVVGAITSRIYQRVVAGETKQVPQLLPELLHFVLLPYIGHARAAKAAARQPLAP
jgi:AcrR family transcriptional regulator